MRLVNGLLLTLLVILAVLTVSLLWKEFCLKTASIFGMYENGVT